MKKVLLLLFFHFPILLLSQNTSGEIKQLSNKMVPEFCGCIQEYGILKGESFGECFALNIGKYEEEILKFYIDDSTQVAQEHNDKFIFELFAGMQEKLFDECDEYYLFIKDMKDSGVRDLISLDVETKMDSLSRVELSKRNADYHFAKGVLFFAKNQYSEAADELLRGLEQEPVNSVIKILLAWTYEEQKNSVEALKIYDQLISETGGIEFVMLKEFTRRNLRTVEKKAPDCLKFQTGKFKIVSPDGLRTTLIERSEDLQIETQVQDNSVTRMSVEWVDNCNYNLRYIESTNPEMDEYIGTELKIKILETTSDSFKFKATMEGVDFVMIEEMTMVK